MAIRTYDAVIFDLLTALLNSWEFWTHLSAIGRVVATSAEWCATFSKIISAPWRKSPA